MASVYEYTDYKRFLNEFIASQPNKGRGLRKNLAEAIRCQVAYVSHVLSGNYHFSIEQAEAASRFFDLSSDDAEYFVLLVSENRAGTHELKEFFKKLLKQRNEKNSLLKNRVKIKETLGREDQTTYYSHGHYAAIHMALTIPKLRTRSALEKQFKLSAKRVQEVLEFLTSRGLAKKDGTQYLPSGIALHLESDSPLIPRHHSNWRMAAMQSFEDPHQQDLHYSGVVTCSEKDIPRVREKLTKCLAECIQIIQSSPEEQVAALCFDWWRL
jgi:uncharacterized protein (TIGR02147 family)